MARKKVEPRTLGAGGGGSEDGRPFVDLTYHTQDERGAAFAKNIPHDPSGTKDCSWCYRSEGT